MDIISPKVLAPIALSIVAAVALYLLTGDPTYLVTILIGLAAGGAGAAAPPAPGVTQRDVSDLSQPGLTSVQVRALADRIARRRTR